MRPSGEEESDRPTPPDLRERVRGAIGAALARDAEHRAGRTGRRLAVAGILGVAGALAITWLVAAHPMDHHPNWHEGFYSTVWAGLLVVTLALGSLDVRTPLWPIANAARAAVLALAIAGLCAWRCPDQHFLRWWSTTRLGGWIFRATDSPPWTAFCLGSLAAAAFALLAALVTMPRCAGRARAWAATTALVALVQAPGIALQSTGEPASVFAGWIGGALLGSAAGVAAAAALRTPGRSYRAAPF